MAKICLDFGHGGSDSGAVNGKRYEKNDVLRLGMKVKKLLQEQGVTVICTRETDKDISINERCKIANNAKANYFLSIHRNSASASATGNEIWVYSKASETDKANGKKILDAVAGVVQMSNRGVKKGAPSYTDFGVIRNTNMSAALLELGFISNNSDNEKFDKYIDQYAEALTKALCSIVKVEYKAKKTNTVLYKVQVGAYKLKINAVSAQSKLKKAGFDTYIVYVAPFYKVQIGAYSNKSNAETTMAKLKKAGFNGFVTT